MTELLDGIDINTQPQFWISVLQIIWINVLLSGDNAIVIALACRNLPQKQRLTGMVLGTGVALLLRLIFAMIVSTLMLLPYVKIVGGLALLVFGLGISIPAIVAGANILMVLLNRFPLIIWAGAGLLGWIAGEVIASDPAVIDSVASFGPDAAARVKLIASVVGMAGTVGFCLISRARDRAPRLEPSE